MTKATRDLQQDEVRESVVLRASLFVMGEAISKSASAPGTSLPVHGHELLKLRSPPLLAAHDASLDRLLFSTTH